MTAHLHFFGCSFTAGDELADAKWFPWKFEEQHTAESYYKRRATCDIDWEKYSEDNKKLAYPALMNRDGIVTYNHARNGESLRTCVLKIVDLLGSGAPVDAIYFQIPVIARELYLSDGNAISLQLSASQYYPHKWNRYAAEKLVSHEEAQWPLEDFLDLQLISSYVKERNIPLTFLVFGDELDHRIHATALLKNHRFVIDQVKKLNVQDVNHILLRRSQPLIGNHYSQESHEDLALYLREHYHKKLKSKY